LNKYLEFINFQLYFIADEYINKIILIYIMKNNSNSIPVVPCHIKELNISCFGCCGNSFSSKKEILKDVLLNTEELTSNGNILSSYELIKFRDRFDGDNALSENGLCYNLVDLGSGCFGCPLHNKVKHILPDDSKLKINNNVDLRVGHCDVNEECETFFAWKTMSDDEKIDFVNFVKKLELDTYSYSVENGSERLFKLYKSQKK
jgi:hypothetical protein